MIETTPSPGGRATLALPQDVAAGFAELPSLLSARSLIVWGEHCSECAYPACYAHCSFYTPRSDLHCRRFQDGFEPVAGSPGLHRIRFRKWGKLEGRGPAPLVIADRARAQERRDTTATGLLHAAPLPHALKRNLSWRLNERKTQVAGATVGAADAFVVEAWASDGLTHPFTLTILSAEPGGAMFQTRFEAGPSYARVTTPLAEIAARVDLSRPFLVQIEPVGEAQGREVVFGTCDFVAFRADARANTAVGPSVEKPVKVVVWDLDETLWTGTLAEDGADGVAVRPEAAALIRALDARGVLQSIASKNDAALVQAALEANGLADVFLHPQAHWEPKSASLATIAASLDLGLDSFVFIDDQPFERAEVTAAHPQVRAVPHTEVAALLTHRWFDLPVTPESARRRAMYQAEARRTQAYTGSGADYRAFLRASGMTIDVRPLVQADAERVFELSQRSNQLNFRGTKLSRDDVSALIAGVGAGQGLSVRCADRFGDYGLIGFVVFRPEEGRIVDLFMSCRVQRKRVEHALFAWLADAALRAGASELRARWRPLQRNGASRAMLEELGFTRVEVGPDDIVEWARDASRPIEDGDIVQVIDGAGERAAA
jgi:FkbH-like protein